MPKAHQAGPSVADQSGRPRALFADERSRYWTMILAYAPLAGAIRPIMSGCSLHCLQLLPKPDNRSCLPLSLLEYSDVSLRKTIK